MGNPLDGKGLLATFREVRDLIAVACFEDIINEDEFMFLWDLHS